MFFSFQVDTLTFLKVSLHKLQYNYNDNIMCSKMQIFSTLFSHTSHTIHNFISFMRALLLLSGHTQDVDPPSLNTEIMITTCLYHTIQAQGQ